MGTINVLIAELPLRISAATLGILLRKIVSIISKQTEERTKTNLCSIKTKGNNRDSIMMQYEYFFIIFKLDIFFI
jgi:hypothetical protein